MVWGKCQTPSPPSLRRVQVISFFFGPFSSLWSARVCRKVTSVAACVYVCVCVCVFSWSANSGSIGWGSKHGGALCTVHTSHPQCQSVSEQRRNPDTQKICLGANLCRLAPFELQLALSHVLHKAQVNKLSLTGDYASREKMLEVGVLFHNRPNQWEY